MKKIICVFFALVICLALGTASFADEKSPRLMDAGDVLTDSDEGALLPKLDSVSDKHKCDIVIVTVDTLDGEDVEDYSNALYETLGYGYGDTDDCLLFLLAMDTRDWAVSKNGFALTAFTNAGFDYIFEKIKPELGDNKFADAFTEYTELCDDFLEKARAGTPYTADNLPKEPFNLVISLAISLVIGLVIALIVTGSMKGKLKSVRFRSKASDYTKNGSLRVTESRELFLYKTVRQTEKEQKSDSDSGSSQNQSGKF